MLNNAPAPSQSPHKLSVLIPVFNEWRTIDTLLRRVLDAPLPIDREVLIADDGSTDGTRDLLRRWRGTADVTCYKVYRAALVRSVQVDANGFDFEAELTARFVQQGARFTEVPISFVGRTIEEGKKIRAIDALYTTQRLWQSRTARSS